MNVNLSDPKGCEHTPPQLSFPPKTHLVTPSKTPAATELKAASLTHITNEAVGYASMHGTNLILGGNTRLSSIRKSQQSNTLIGAAITILIIVLIFIENSINYQAEYESTSLSTYLRMIIILFSCIHLLLIYKYYLSYHTIRKHYKHISDATKLYQDTRTMKFLLFEISISFISMPPGVNPYHEFAQLNTSATVSLSDVVTSLSFLRLYHLLKCIYKYSRLNHSRVYFYCALHSINSEAKLVYKHLIRQYPVRTALGFITSTCIVIGLLLYLWERSVPDSLVNNFWNALWLSGVTQTTLGFGEIVPKTHLGRMYAFLAAMMGLLNESYMVMMVERRSSLKSSEFDFYSRVLYNRKIKKVLMPLATVSIQRFVRLHQKRVRGLYRLREFICMCLQFQHFRQARETIQSHKNLNVRELITLLTTKIPEKLRKTNDSLSNIHNIEGVGKVIVRKQFMIQQQLASIGNSLARQFQYFSEKDSGTNAHRKYNTLLNVSPGPSKAKMKQGNKDARKKMLNWIVNRERHSTSRSGSSQYSDSKSSSSFSGTPL